MRVICPECEFERQIDAVFAGPQVRVRCSRCDHRFGVEPNTAGVVGRPAKASAAKAPPATEVPRPAWAPPPEAASKAKGEVPKRGEAPRSGVSRPEKAVAAGRPKTAGTPSPSPVNAKLKRRPKPWARKKEAQAEEDHRPASEGAEEGRARPAVPAPRVPTSAADADTLRMAAEKSFLKNDLDVARAGFEACLAFDEEHAHDHYQLGRVLLKLSLGGDESIVFDDVKRHFLKAAELRPSRADYFMALADLAKREDNDRLALGYHKKVLEIDPSHHGALREVRLHKRRKAQGGPTPSSRLKALFGRGKDKAAKPGKGEKASKLSDEEKLEFESS